MDILQKLVQVNAVAVYISVTTLDEKVRRKMEPCTASPELRLATIQALSKAGIPIGILVAPLIPGLTDHELPKILMAGAKAGAKFAGVVPLRLPFAVKELFEDWLTKHFPLHKKKVINQIRAMHGGKLNDPRFGYRFQGEGVFAEQIESLFKISCKKAGLEIGGPELSIASFRRVATGQLELFS